MMLATVLMAAAVSTVVPGEGTWGGRDRHLAVVDPAVGEDPANTLSLDGEWDFTTFEREGRREVPLRNGIWGFYCRTAWKNARKIVVPSCWEAQGVGEPGDAISWDPKWDDNPKPIRHLHMGAGWYRREVVVPAAWQGRRVWLKLGGVKSVGYVWVNERQVALVDGYCGSFKYDVTDLVRPGEKATVVIQADNRVPSRKGLLSAMHRWGGVYRGVALEATPAEAYVDDAWVRGDFDAGVSEAHVTVATDGGRETPRGTRLRFSVDGASAEVEARAGENVVRLPLNGFRPWSPEHPNLYTGTVELVANGAVVQRRRERFGIRKLEVRGREFYLNNRPFFFRGFGDDHVYPMTGLTPADVNAHRAHLAKARAAGFNFVRLHTHCEVPEYFEAADELGIMIQAELPYYSDVPTEGFAFDPVRDVTELWQNYRRHPSFAVYSMGNEGSFGDALDRHLHRLVKGLDPDRLKINQDVHVPGLSTPDRADFVGGPTKPWPRGSWNPDRPFLTHEYLNLCVKHDARSEGKYTGVWMPPTTRAAREKWLGGFGLGPDWGDRLQDAQHALQGVWQKDGLESARLDPHCDGYIFWTIVDVVVWNDAVKSYSAQGLFDPFWEAKPRGLAAADFAKFNSPSCVLVDFEPARRVFVAGETLKANVQFAHYGEAVLVGATLEWKLTAGASVLAAGTERIGDQPLGGVRPVKGLSIAVPDLAVPAKAKLSVAIGDVANDWDLWLFPKGRTLAEIRARAAKLGVTVATGDSAEAKAARTARRALVTVDDTEGAPNVKLGWWWMGSQVGTAIKDHPALGNFPHDGVLNPLWFRILKTGRKLPVAGVKPEDLVIVGEGGTACYLYLAVSERDGTKVAECHGLDLLCDLPEANALLDALVSHCAGRR